MNLNVLTNHPIYQKMQPEKQKLLQECIRLTGGDSHSEGVNFDKMLPIMLAMHQKMQKQGLNFTAEERNVLIDVLSAELSPSERARMEMMKKMMH